MKIQLAVFATVKRTSHVDQVLSAVGINAPVAVFFGFRQRASGDAAGQSEVIQFLLLRPKANDQIVQAASPIQLGDRQRAVLLRATERMDFAIALAANHATIEWAARNKIHDLRENQRSLIHK